MSAQQGLAVARDGDVLWLRIDRPGRRNALARALLERLGEVMGEQAGDASLRLAVITGAGERAFAAGGDLEDLAGLRGADDGAALFDLANDALDAVRRFPVPVIAALNGVALGGGLELALACDLRIAAAHARVGFLQARLKVSTGFGGGTDLIRLVGPSRALALLAGAAELDAESARAQGLVDAVAPAEVSFETFAEDYAARMAAHPPQVLRAFKALALAARLGADRAELQRVEREAFAETWAHPDHWATAEAILRDLGRGGG